MNTEMFERVLKEREIGLCVSGKYKSQWKIPLIMEICGGSCSSGMRGRM